jgi:hypothetical protein
VLTLDTVQRGFWAVAMCIDVRVRMRDGCAFVFTLVLHSYGPKIEKEKKKKKKLTCSSLLVSFLRSWVGI